MEIKTIAHIKTDFPSKFGLPRQSGLVEEIKGKIVFEKEYRVNEAVRGLADYSHIWLIWDFSKAHTESWSPTVRPPLLGGNKRMGVFATRSPFRPNPIGLSSVRLEGVEITKDEGPVLYVSGVDIMDGTPIFDIKPYLPYADAHSDATGGFTDTLGERKLTVLADDEILALLTVEQKNELLGVLAGDPRPSYIEDEERIYGFSFAGYEVKFRVSGDRLTLVSIEEGRNL